MKRKKPAPRQREVFPEGKKLLGYPKSYEGPRRSVTTMQNGTERYVYIDGTFDPRSTVLTRENDTFVRIKKAKGEPMVWERVALGREIPRMPIGEYVELIQGMPQTPETQTILSRLGEHLPELGVDVSLGSTATAQGIEQIEVPQAA